MNGSKDEVKKFLEGVLYTFAGEYHTLMRDVTNSPVPPTEEVVKKRLRSMLDKTEEKIIERLL